MAISEICADKVIALYHSSLFAGCQGLIKTYLTISNKFLIPILYIISDPTSRDVTFANYCAMKNHQQDNYKPE